MKTRKLRWLSVFLTAALTLGTLAAALSVPATAQQRARTFPETGKTVSGRFLDYWLNDGGLTQYGYPITDEFQERSALDGNVYNVQYFERAVFEAHPENSEPFDVLLSQLGRLRYSEKYPDGAPNQRASTDNPLRFAQTGKTVGGRFRQYWEQNGGLVKQGLPISDEFTEVSDLDNKPYTVQYFERAVFELHPENGVQYHALSDLHQRSQAASDVQLSHLGKSQLDDKYPQGAPTPIPGVVPTPVAGCVSNLRPGRWTGPVEEQVKFKGEGFTGRGTIRGETVLDVVCNGAFTGTTTTTSFTAEGFKGPIKLMTCTSTVAPAADFNGKQEVRPDGLHLVVSGGRLTKGTVKCTSPLLPDRIEQLTNRAVNSTDIKVEGVAQNVISGTNWLADPLTDAVLEEIYATNPDAQIETTSTGKWVLTYQGTK
jgi:hypothetical protein